MAEPQNDRQTPERYEETTDPKNPPASVVNKGVRSAALRSYLGPLVVFFVVVGLALIYWANRAPVRPDSEDQQQIGTSGVPDDRLDTVGERGNRDDTSGGFDPAPRPDSTADELKFRGGDSPSASLPGARRDATLTGLAMLEGAPKDLVGRRIDFSNVIVIDAENPTHFWIQDRNVKTEVTAPRGGSAVKNGMRVNVNGVVEEDGRGGVRIKADSVDVQ